MKSISEHKILFKHTGIRAGMIVNGMATCNLPSFDWASLGVSQLLVQMKTGDSKKFK